jgi:hypothetical protein
MPLGGHLPFAVLNRTGNRALRVLMHTPAERLVSGNLALLTVTGRSSGREFTFPVMYRRSGDSLTVNVGWPERKRWWRNLVEPGMVRVRLDGRERMGIATAAGDERQGVRVDIELSG